MLMKTDSTLKEPEYVPYSTITKSEWDSCQKDQDESVHITMRGCQKGSKRIGSSIPNFNKNRIDSIDPRTTDPYDTVDYEKNPPKASEYCSVNPALQRQCPS
jgi:hypothetical protein